MFNEHTVMVSSGRKPQQVAHAGAPGLLTTILSEGKMVVNGIACYQKEALLLTCLCMM